MKQRVALIVVPVLLAFAASARAAESGETPSAWVEWSRQFAEQLEREQRGPDIVEELSFQGALLPDDKEPFAAAAYLSIQLADMPPERLAPGAHFYVLAERWIAEAVRRQTAADPTAIEEGRGDPRLAYAIGRLRFADASQPANAGRMGPLMGTARSMFLQALEAEPVGRFDPDAPKAWYFRAAVNFAQVLIQEELVGEAHDVLKDAFDRFETFPGLSPIDRRYGLIARAEVFRALQEHERAIEVYRDVIKNHPDSPRAHLGMGRVLFDTNHIAEALVHLQRAAETSSLSVGEEDTLAEALLLSVSALLKVEPPQPDQAEQVLERYFKIRKDHPDGLNMEGLIAFDRGDFAQARNAFRRVHRKVKDDRATLVKLIETLQRLGDTKGVEEMGAELRRVEPLAALR
jgi:Tfp pilus assembly protein PilF